MAHRASTGGQTYQEERRPAAERWDRERFERYSRRAPEERDAFFFERERDRFSEGRDRRESGFEERRESDRRNTTKVVLERDQYYEDDRHERPGRRPSFLDHETTPSEIANKALAPYRRKTVVEREASPPARRPQRPSFLRRQSSLDTFDRRPMPRYGDRDREEWRPPTNVPIPLPIRERPSRRSSPPRHTFEAEFERRRRRESESTHRENEFEEDHISERSSRRKSSGRRSSVHKAQSSRRSSSSSSSSSSDSESTVRQIGKKGRTRMPRRLAHVKAVIDMGLPYEEEDDFIVIQRALEKETIDEVIKISENYKETRTTYVFEDNKFEAPPFAPPPPASSISSSSAHTMVAPPSHRSSIHSPPPPPPPAPQSVRNASPPRHSMFEERFEETNYPRSVRTVSPNQRTVFEERIEESNRIQSPLKTLRTVSPTRGVIFEEHIEESSRVQSPLTTLVVPSRHHRSGKDIKDEIRALEEERQLLRYERDGEFDVVVERKPRRRSVVRVEKDRKASNKKMLAAMMATLS